MPKRKTTPTSFFDRLWYEYLFTRTFDLETDLSATEVGDDLMGLRESLSWNPLKVGFGFFFPRSRTVDIKYEGEGVYSFDIRTKRRNRSVDYTMAKATGFIEEENGRTTVQGQVQFGVVYHTLMLTLPIVMILMFSFAMSFMPLEGFAYAWGITLPIFIILLTVFWGWWRMAQDRNQLMQEIQTLLGEKQKREARLSAEAYDEQTTAEVENLQRRSKSG